MSIPEEFTSLSWVRAEAVTESLSQGEKLTIIDVRNAEEFATGHIRGALNVESTRFTDAGELDRLVDTVKTAGPVVVHCQLCQKRGPTAASRLVARLKELGLDASKVSVLQGGFSELEKVVSEAGAAKKELVIEGPAKP